jgi:hypothetical protein
MKGLDPRQRWWEIKGDGVMEAGTTLLVVGFLVWIFIAIIAQSNF